MKQHLTQKLFWKKWPYKAIVEIANARSGYGGNWSYSRRNNSERVMEFARLKDWFKNHLPEAGIRCETHLSVFLSTEAELAEVIDAFGSKVIETWKPASESARDLLIEHEYDVVRDRLWYGRFPIRARIPYNHEFRSKGSVVLKSALESIEKENWYCAGLLHKIVDSTVLPSIYGWGQPLHLYLLDSDDAVMLRLYCGDYIERFERIRKP